MSLCLPREWNASAHGAFVPGCVVPLKIAFSRYLHFIVRGNNGCVQAAVCTWEQGTMQIGQVTLQCNIKIGRQLAVPIIVFNVHSITWNPLSSILYY